MGRRYAVDAHAFNPVRARVKAGTILNVVNNGQMTHTLVADDGSWTLGPPTIGETGTVRLDKPGTSRYRCKEHPWAMGELTVE